MREIDARGLRCPQPIIELGKAISEIALGHQITLLSDDPATEPDLSAWSRMTGNTFEKKEKDTFLVTKLSEAASNLFCSTLTICDLKSFNELG